MERPPLVVLLLGFSSIYKNLVAAALRLWAILRSLRSLRGYSLLKIAGLLGVGCFQYSFDGPARSTHPFQTTS